MLCSVCRTTLPDSSSFCPRCGNKLASGSGSKSPLSKLQIPKARILGIVVAAVLLPIASFFAILHVRLVRSSAFQEAFVLAQSSPELRNILGEDVRSVGLVLGTISHRFDSDFAQWSMILKGSTGRGRLYAVANRATGDWDFSRLTFVAEKGGRAVELTPSPRRLMLPKVDPKNVYLLPLQFSLEEPLDWAPAFYAAKFGVHVTLLPPDSTACDTQDPQRHQLDARKCLDLLLRSHPDLANDPSAILIGITSRDMNISSFDWDYALNYRRDDRLAIVSVARVQLPSFLNRWNPEWRLSRLQKMITKNLALLYFDLPLSNDYTSMVRGGIPSGDDVDYMTGEINGAGGYWHSWVNGGEPGMSVVDIPGKLPVWKMECVEGPLPDTRSQLFNVYMATGLFVQKRVDFRIDEEFPLELARTYRNKDDKSRAFGIGGQSSLDIFLVGQMGTYIDLILEEGTQIHFDRVRNEQSFATQLYRAKPYQGDRFSRAEAIYEKDGWRLKTIDGWTYFFPYRPKAQSAMVTVLTGFIDPTGHRFEMERDATGDLMGVKTPGGKWLHLEHDTEHRIRSITASTGRIVNYRYDVSGRLVAVSDSDGNSESYTYDDKSQMLTVEDGSRVPRLTNTYFPDGSIRSQTLADGRKFYFWYERDLRNLLVSTSLTDPNGMMTSMNYSSHGYTQSLPTPTPH
jgi:YD repeat-containing protein